MAITISSIVGINHIISNQQELANVNEEIIEKQLNKIQETISISGAVTSNRTAMISNVGTQDIGQVVNPLTSLTDLPTIEANTGHFKRGDNGGGGKGDIWCFL